MLARAQSKLRLEQMVIHSGQFHERYASFNLLSSMGTNLVHSTAHLATKVINFCKKSCDNVSLVHRISFAARQTTRSVLLWLALLRTRSNLERTVRSTPFWREAPRKLNCLRGSTRSDRSSSPVVFSDDTRCLS